MEDLVRESRFLAYLLRHHPEDLGLTLDPEGGWVCASRLVEAVNASGRFTEPWTGQTLEAIAEQERRRFALDREGWRICARGGHSVEGVVPLPASRGRRGRRGRGTTRKRRSSSGSLRPPSSRHFLLADKGRRTASGRLNARETRKHGAVWEVEPAELLFHVTDEEDPSRRIARHGGLRPRPGQFLKLFSDWASAMKRLRKAGSGRIVVVEAAAAFEAGVRFLLGRHGVIRCGFLPKAHLWLEEAEFSKQRAAGCVVVGRGEAGARFALIRTRPRREVLAELAGKPLPPVGQATPARRDWSARGRLELPKGKIEAGETAKGAALRELREETGIEGEVEVICPLPSIYYVYRVPGGRPVSKSVSFFLARCVESDPVFRPKSQEGIIGVEWHAPDAALEAVAFDNLRPILRVARDLVSSGADLEL